MKLRIVFETVEEDGGTRFRRAAGELEVLVHDDEQLQLLSVYAEGASDPIVVVSFNATNRWVPAPPATDAFYDTAEGELFALAADEELARRKAEAAVRRI